MGGLAVAFFTWAAMAASAATARSRTAGPAAIPVEPCAQLMTLTGLPYGGQVTSAVDEPAADGTPAYCSVSIAVPDDVSVPGLPDDTNIFLTLPDDNWNGSFMAEGGGVYAGEATPPTDQLAAGYAASTTDTGHQEDPFTSEWVIDPPNGVNWNRIDAFGYLSLHYDAVESKAVIDAYYGLRPRYSFWNGCSTGGRQGLSEAEKYPGDFNGILAGAPALDWTRFIPAELWPQYVQLWSGDELPPCKSELVNSTLQAQCPDQDGQVDGVFDPRNCNVLAILDSLIGTSTPCGTFTALDAKVIEEIWQGPTNSGSQTQLLHGKRIWFGLEPGADIGSTPGLDLGGTEGSDDGLGPQVGVPPIWDLDWMRDWVHMDQSWLWTSETSQQFFQDMQTSISLYHYALDVNNPNLKAFRDRGGKIVMWQGLADQLIFTGDSINFYNRVLGAMGGLQSTQKFFRYFLAPGVSHCGTPGAGSIAPADPMQAVVDWVEDGRAPSTLAASGTINGVSVTRPLCPYPDPDAVYTGGDPDKSKSYTCEKTAEYDNPLHFGPAGNTPTLPSGLP